MSIDLVFLFATDEELRLRCRGWKRVRRLAEPQKIEAIDPFTKKPMLLERTWECDDPDEDASSALALTDCLLHGTSVGNPLITEAAINRLGDALRIPGGPAVLPGWVGPGDMIESISPELTRLLRTTEGGARARDVASGVEVERALVEGLIRESTLAGEVGRELHLHAEVDGVAESWSTLADAFEASHPRVGRDELALLRALAADAHDVLYGPPIEGASDLLASRLLASRLRPFVDRILVQLARDAMKHGEIAEVVAHVVAAIDATPSAFDEAAHAAIAWTFPAMVQVCGKRFGVDAAFRVLASRPQERALVRALYFHEVADPHRDVAVDKLVARVSRLPGDDHRPALEAIVARKGAAAVAAAERLLLTTPDPPAAWVDTVIEAASPESLLRSLAMQPRDAVRARIAAALADATDASRAQDLVIALLHSWFGEPGFDAAVPGRLAVLVTTDGVPTRLGAGVGNLTRDVVAPWRRCAVEPVPDAVFDDARWAMARPPRDATTLSPAERAMLADLHACELVWSQDLPVLGAYGLPGHRRELGDYLGIPTPARAIVLAPPALRDPILLRAHDDVDAEALHVLHVVRDYLDETFAAPMVVARALPLDHPRPPMRFEDGMLSYDWLPGHAQGFRGTATIIICAGPAVGGGFPRFGQCRSKTGAFSLHAIREGHDWSELLPRALRVLAQLSLLLLGYPFCPSRACLLAPTSVRRPREPGEHMIVNASFGPLPDVMSVPLVPCIDCLAAAARQARRTPAEHLEALAAFFMRHGLTSDAAAATTARAAFVG